MRSTVSYMLSHGSGDPIMSYPDFEQHAHHHGCLLVLLRGIGPSKPRSLQKIFERVERINSVKVTDSAGQQREIWIRYIHEHPAENNDWGDFQTHRRLLGLVTIGKFDNQTELNELCRLHESLKVKYVSTLYDSRCILFGPPEQPSNHSVVNNCTSNADEVTVHNSQNSTSGEAKSKPSPPPVPPRRKLQETYTTPSNFKSRAIFWPENHTCTELETLIQEFVSALFWILESKRLERSRDKIDKVPLLLAPFEKKDFVGLDMESRQNRKRCIGRVTKNLGDLTLQAGLVADSLNLYHAASETLRAISDSLWLGAAEEGCCAASAILLYPNIRQTEILHRNASLQDGVSPSRAVIEKRRASGADLIRKMSSEHQNSANEGGGGGITSNSSSTSSVSSILTSSSSSSSSSSTTLAANLRNDSSALPANILTADEIIGQYRKAIINYSKYRHAGIIETESALKAARICIEQGRNLDVAMFLQNVFYINLNINEQGKIRRFETLTNLYQRIGFHRKAAFCQRLAASRHIANSNQNPDWAQSYRLMLESFGGHMLSLDPLEVIENQIGWPMLQIHLLQQLVMASRRLGHSALATRHMTFLLQTQWNNMTANEQKEMALQLQSLSAQCEGSPVPLVLENGTVIPPANLTDIPYCIQFDVKDLASHLKPRKLIEIKVDSGPFLFTPIHFSSIDRRVNKKKENKIAFQWVQHELSEITLKLRNTLPFELTISDMKLLTNGIVFEALPQTIVLQPGVPTTVSLHGTPIESGQLEIQGYSTHTLGVKSNCRLKNMLERPFPPNYLIDVIPALPKMSATTSLPQTATFSNLSNADSVITSASVAIYHGEKVACLITLKNESNIPVECLDVSIHSSFDASLQGKFFKIDYEDIQRKLPIKHNETLEFQVEIFGEASFISQLGGLNSPHSGASATLHEGPHSLSHSVMSSGHASLPSRMSSPVANISTAPRRNELTSSFRSTHSAGHSSLATLSLAPPGGSASQSMEAQIRLKYSGGEAMQDGYCRQCAVSFCLEMLPSAQITNWDILPAEIPSQFYLVLDISNMTAQEMSLNYTSSKNILIEANESCRVPVPVDRCSLEELISENSNETSDETSNFVGGVKLTVAQLYARMSEKTCSEHIAERVKLSWMLTGTETKGISSVKGITLTPSMIDLITVAPIQWDVKFNDILVQPQAEIACIAGQYVKLSIGIFNASKQALHHLIVTARFYQDYQNSILNYHLETRVVMTGRDQIYIPILEKDAITQHECSLLFLTPGRFKADIRCRSLSSTENVKKLGGALDDLFLQNFTIGNSSTTSNTITLNDPRHVWRFIPPVEITVTEVE